MCVRTRLAEGALLVLAGLFASLSCTQAGAGPGTPAAGSQVSQPLPPEFSLSNGLYHSEIQVALSTPAAGALIRYTTDGSDPDATAPLYSSPIPIPADEDEWVVKAVVESSGGTSRPPPRAATR